LVERPEPGCGTYLYECVLVSQNKPSFLSVESGTLCPMRQARENTLLFFIYVRDNVEDWQELPLQSEIKKYDDGDYEKDKAKFTVLQSAR
jgi:hypothetical protein